MSQVFRPVSESKHFAEGSPCPENPKILRLYSMKFCPYAQRTRLVIAAKKIQNEVVNINLNNRPAWYYQKNPMGKVPTLELENGNLIYESLVTADYLDEVYPNNPLNSSDPLKKAQDRMLIELFGVKVGSCMVKLYSANREDEASWKVPVNGIHEGLVTFEKELEKRGTPFFGGIHPGMMDYMIWPWLERLPMWNLVHGDLIKISLDNTPLLTKWCEMMMKDEAVQESYISPENHTIHLRSRLAGHPDYDMELC